MNKRGDVTAVFFVFLALALFGFVLYSFNTNNKTIQATLSGQEELENVYFESKNFEFGLKETGEKSFVDTYNYFIDDDKYIKNRIMQENYPVFNEVSDNLNEEFKNEFSKRFIEEIKQYDSRLNNENFEFSLNGENIIVNVKNNHFESKNDELSVTYNPSLTSEFSYNHLGLNSFKDILSVKKSCETSSEKKKCYEGKLSNFNISIENKETFEIIILTSKREFLVVKEVVDQNNELTKISNIERIQVIFRE